MASIDRLGWTAGLSVAPYGHRLGIRTNDPEVLARVRRECLPADWRVKTRGRPEVDFLYSLRVGPPARSKVAKNYHLVYASTRRIARTLDLDEALAALRDRVIDDLIWFASEMVVLDAGLAERDGRALLLPGNPEGFHEALDRPVRRGPVLLDAEARVTLLAPPRAEARARGWRPGRPPLPVEAVVFPRQGARVREIAPADAAMRLFQSAPQASLRPKVVLERLGRVVEEAACLEAPEGGGPALLRKLARSG